jgi:hypothetical protein
MANEKLQTNDQLRQAHKRRNCRCKGEKRSRCEAGGIMTRQAGIQVAAFSLELASAGNEKSRVSKRCLKGSVRVSLRASFQVVQPA